MITRIISRRGLNLSISGAVAYCELDFEEDDIAKEEQANIALQLSALYFYGAPDVNRDEEKALYYYLKATLLNPPADGLDFPSYIYYYFGFFTTARLFTVRLNRVLSLEMINKPFLFPAFSILGMSYFAEFSFDFFQMVKSAYHAMPKLEEELTGFAWLTNRSQHFWRCFKIALDEDNRKYRMLNSLMWGTLNLVLFLGTAGIGTVLLNLGGFLIDVLNEIENARKTIEKYETILPQINEKISSLTNQKRELISVLTQLELLKAENLKNPGLNYDINKINTEIQTHVRQLAIIKQELASYSHQKTVLEQKIKNLKTERLKNILIVSLIFIGVVLYIVPGLNTAAFAIGATIVLAASCYYLGKKLWNLGNSIHHYFTKKETHGESSLAKPEIKQHILHELSKKLTRNTPSPMTANKSHHPAYPSKLFSPLSPSAPQKKRIKALNKWDTTIPTNNEDMSSVFRVR